MSDRHLRELLDDVEELIPEIVTQLGHAYLGQGERERSVQQKSKHRRDVVAVQDVEAERLLRQKFKAKFPEIGFVGEELLPSRGAEHSMHWIIDALDGTLNYSAGIPHFATSVALATESEVIFGCIYDPSRTEMFTARKGNGVALNGRRLRPLRAMRVEEAIIAIGLGYDDERAKVAWQIVERLRPTVRAIRMSGCAALDLAYVACGRVAGVFHPYLKIWDRSAGELMVSEVGGVVEEVVHLSTDDSHAKIAANPAVVELLRSVVGAGVSVAQE